jgi:hypothetical protein
VSQPPDDEYAGNHGPHEQVGSLADEAVRLFGALSDWARDATEEPDEHVHTGSPECTWCPLCRTVHAVRQAAPEVRGHLAVAASALLQAAAGVLADAAASDAHRGTGVEHIDLEGDLEDDVDGVWPEEDDE